MAQSGPIIAIFGVQDWTLAQITASLNMNARKNLSAWTILIAAISLPLYGATKEPVFGAGEYISEGGWGVMTVKGAASHFEISARGANGHSCNIDGDIVDGISTVVSEGLDTCIVKFTRSKNGIEVSIPITREACQAYCGARASFDGFYLAPARGCDSASVNRTRNKFKQLYDKKAFIEAQAILTPFLADCGKTTYWFDLGRIRNDLAITAYKLYQYATCLSVLEPLVLDADLPDDQHSYLPPMDLEAASLLNNSTRTNLKLCRTALKKSSTSNSPNPK